MWHRRRGHRHFKLSDEFQVIRDTGATLEAQAAAFALEVCVVCNNRVENALLVPRALASLIINGRRTGGIAKKLKEAGAELAISYQGEVMLKRVKPLADELLALGFGLQ